MTGRTRLPSHIVFPRKHPHAQFPLGRYSLIPLLTHIGTIGVRPLSRDEYILLACILGARRRIAENSR
ncbi:unnamed protein product [Linum trigynum]|uniref:Uncharacterized protein n=1 Tax=Linum trigynum TaxID=586398 RepID=A0AAV2EH94_9ROSI